jgi:hypothetical protein
MVMDAFDSLVAQGIVRASQVFFLVPAEVRDAVGKVTRDLGRYWAPGDQGGLLVDVSKAHPEFDLSDINTCLRFGPIERLYGDLYMMLREYELLLWGVIRAVLVERFQEGRKGWWRSGVPEAVRLELVKQQELYDLEEPWQAMTLGNMQKTLSSRSNKTHFASAMRLRDLDQLDADVRAVAEIRNAVMHPVRRIPIAEDDFLVVMAASHRLHDAVRAARESGATAEDYLPTPAELLLAPRLRVL